MPIVSNSRTGITTVPDELKKTTMAKGMIAAQIMKMFELPLTTKTIMVGVSTTMVIDIGTTTLAAFIGAGGLVEPTVKRISLNNSSFILCDTVPAVHLSLICEELMSRLEGLLETKRLRVSQ